MMLWFLVLLWMLLPHKKVIPNLSGLNAVVIGRSNINGKPMTQLLLKENCTVTIVHSKTKNIEKFVKMRDCYCSSWKG